MLENEGTPGLPIASLSPATSARESTAASAGRRGRAYNTQSQSLGIPPDPGWILPAGGIIVPLNFAGKGQETLGGPDCAPQCYSMRWRPAARYACNGAQRTARGKGGLCSLNPPPIAPVRPPLRSFSSAAAAAAPRGSAPSSLACVPSWQYLRVREIVEEEGRELFIQQRAAVVPRHLPAAAAACGGVSGEPARGRERASERESGRGGGRRQPGGRVEGGARAPGCGRRAGCGGGAARAWGRTPRLFLLRVWR